MQIMDIRGPFQNGLKTVVWTLFYKVALHYQTALVDYYILYRFKTIKPEEYEVNNEFTLDRVQLNMST